MPYVLEEITPADQEKILTDAECDEKKKKFLLARGGYFSNNPNLKWAVDRERNSYLFWAPRPPMTEYYHYYFYFKSFLYALCIKSMLEDKIHFDDIPLPNPLLLPELKQAIIEAFSIHKIHGSRPVFITFLEEN